MEGAGRMDVLISCFWIPMEVSAMLLFEAAFLRRRVSRFQVFCVMLGFLVLSLVNDLSLFYRLPPMPQKMVNIALGVISAVLIFAAPWYVCAAAAVSSYFVLGVIDTLSVYGAAALMEAPLSALMADHSLWFLLVTGDKFLCLFLCWALFRLRHKREYHAPSLRRVLATTLLPLMSVAVMFQMYFSSQGQQELSAVAVTLALVILLANIAVFYLMDSMDRASASEKELALLNQSMALQTENYRALERSYRGQRSASHEFKHQLQVIGDLLREGNTREAQDYVTELQSQQTSRLFAAKTGSTIVDAILNEKYHSAREKGIDISYKVNDLSGLKLSTDALVVILSNLLENAIEACCRLPEGRKIECSLLLEESLFLSVRNTALPVKIVDGRIETTKENKAEHGYGLAAVRRILRQLRGELVIDYREPWFQIVAEIPNK